MVAAERGSSSCAGSRNNASDVAVLVTLNNNVVVWCNQPRSRTSIEDTWRNTLTYYSFFDDKRFTHLDSLLTRLAPISEVHIACTEKLQGASPKKKNGASSRNKAKQVSHLLSTLQSLIDSRCAELQPKSVDDNTDDPEQGGGNSGNKSKAASAPEEQKLCAVHVDVPFSSSLMDKNIIDSIISQLLVDDKKVQLSYRGDVQLSSHPYILKGLGFWLHSQGLLNSTGGAVPDDIIGSYRLKEGILNSHLLLDRTAASCIHLLPPPNAGLATVVGGTQNNNSLYGILSQPCQTKMGKRLVESWLRQPLIQLDQILYRQNAVRTLVEDGVGRDSLRGQGLRSFTTIDVARLASQIGSYEESARDNNDPEKTVASSAMGSTRSALQSLYQLYLLTTQKLPLLVDMLQNVIVEEQSKRAIDDNSSSISATDNSVPIIANGRSEQQSSQESESLQALSTEMSLLEKIFTGLNKTLAQLHRAGDLAEAVLDLDEAPREFLIKSSYKPELQEIKDELSTVDTEIEECHIQMNQLWAEITGIDENKNQVRLEMFGNNDNTNSNCMWQFRLPNTNDSKILNEQLSDKVKVHRLLKNGVYFSTKELRELSTKKLDLLAEYEKCQRELALDAMRVASTYQAPLERINDLVAALDGLSSLAHVAAYSQHGYCRPKLTDSDEDGFGIELEEARHPCVELQENIEFIPNDVNLVFGGSSFLLITGPNMGGKSTYIRSVGAIVTLAQIGSYVPAKSATINICHHILARVGAGDLQDRGISTFMAEMLESSSILQKATKRSLIIVDELGRGTSTFDGYGLAKAISEHIINAIGCLTIFATHFHELTALENEQNQTQIQLVQPGAQSITSSSSNANHVVKNCHVTAQKGNQGLTFLYQIQPGPCLESFGIQVAEMANVPSIVINDAKMLAKKLESFDYNKQNYHQREQNEDRSTAATKEKRAMDFMDQFRSLPMHEFQSKEEKMAALLKLVESAS